MKVDYKWANTIAEFDEENWDTVARDQIAMTHRWHRVMEIGLRDHRPLYLLLKDLEGPLAIAAANQSGFLGGTKRREELLKRVILTLSPPYSSFHCGVVVRPGAALNQVIPTLEAAMKEICRRERRLVWAIGNVPPSTLDDWQAHRFHVIKRPPLTHMDLPQSSYEEGYMGSLSREKRRRLRRMRRHAEKQGVTFEHSRHPGAWGEQLYPLLGEVYTYHGASAPPFRREIFATLERHMPEETVLFVGKVKGQVAGFALGLLGGDSLFATMAGLRYELAQPNYVYFLLLDELIRWSIQNRLRSLYTGLTSYEAKQLQGFHLQPRYMCLRANGSLLDRFLGLMLPLGQRILNVKGR